MEINYQFKNGNEYAKIPGTSYRDNGVDLQIVVTYFFRFIFTCSFIDYHIIIFILKMFSPCFSRFAPPYFMIKTPFPDRVLPGKGFLEILFANAFDCTG